MTNSVFPLLAIHAPSMELLIICLFGASLPISFFIWMKWWLGTTPEENPDQAIAAQAKADQEHASHHGHGQGHGHGHGHGHDHHAHA